MKFLTLLSLLVTLLFGLNPKPYASLGDAIYDSAYAFESLAPNLPSQQSVIETYVEDAKKVKALGFEAEVDNKMAKNYLKALRSLDGQRQKLLAQINSELYRAMDEKNLRRFSAIVKSDLISLYKASDDILPFYEKNYKKGAIPVLDEMLAEEMQLARDKKKANAEYEQKVETRRIERMREASETADSERERELNENLAKEHERVNQMLESEMIR